jgi:large subunit ribosomal protein L5
MAKQKEQPKEQKEVKDKKAKGGEEQKQPKVVEEKVPARLKEKYAKEIVPKLKEQFGYKNVMQVPKLSKIVVNMGVGQATQDQKILEEAVKEMETITGQKVSVRTAKNAISNFKLREGMKIGARLLESEKQCTNFR